MKGYTTMKTRKKYQRRQLHDLPKNVTAKHVPLVDINEYYELYEDGRIFSRVTGKFLTVVLINNHPVYCLVTNGKNIAYSADFLVRKYFTGLPQFDYVQHVPLKGYENEYQVYSDGRIYSKINYDFLTPKKTKTNWKFVCILDKKCKRKTCYIARAVWESFVGPIGYEYKIKFLDEDRQNCCLENLDLQLKAMYEN